MTKYFPNLGRDLDIQIYAVNGSSHHFDPKWSSPRHIIIKMSKSRLKKILKAAKEIQL